MSEDQAMCSFEPEIYTHRVDYQCSGARPTRDGDAYYDQWPETIHCKCAEHAEELAARFRALPGYSNVTVTELEG